ncbi:MAG: gamma-glutamylcyclotransferase family protein [Polaromonas sp.]
MADTINHTDNDTDAAISAAAALRHVFVYGTLRRGEQRDINLLLPTPVFRGQATVSGVLYDLGDYPGMRLGGGQPVQGEVYQIAPELERLLDEIEEVWPQQTGEYARREVRVQLGGASAPGAGPGLSCLVYEIAHIRTAGMPVIASGDWLRRQGDREMKSML